MKIKKSNNISIFMTKGDANSGSEDKAWAVKQYDLSKSHPNHTTLANTFQPYNFQNLHLKPQSMEADVLVLIFIN